MRLVPALFATALGMCVVVGIALLIPEVPDGHGFPHPEHASMSQSLPGLERHTGVLWLGWGFGALQIVFFALLVALGARKGTDLRGLGKPLVWGTAAYIGVWTLIVISYRSYVTESAPELYLGLPLPTALFLYVHFPLPVIFVLCFTVGYKRWVFTDEDLQEYERLLESKKARGSGDGERV